MRERMKMIVVKTAMSGPMRSSSRHQMQSSVEFCVKFNTIKLEELLIAINITDSAKVILYTLCINLSFVSALQSSGRSE